MRVMVRVQIPVEQGNAAIMSGKLPETFKQFADRWKPEAAYFLTQDGERTALFVLDMKDTSQMPVIAEPFFMAFNADVHWTTVMNVDDLMKGLSQIK